MSEVYRFGRFELQVDRQELRRDEVLVAVEPKPLEVLAELLRNAGELVSKTELMDNVWPGRIVTESVIARSINKLRAALDDASQTLILNVHGFGYRFSGVVTSVEGAPSDSHRVRDVPRPKKGDRPPLRPNWRLTRPLDPRATIWLAQHEKTGENHVFKFGLEPGQVPALRREAALHRLLLRGLGERGDIARLLDYNLTAPPLFLEMDYCSQGNLADWCQSQGGVERVPLELRIELVAQAAEALAAAHALGVLHMDIKPSNLLVWTGTDGQPRLRLSDFGSGRLLQPGRLTELGITHLGFTKTMAGGADSIRGTLNYLAPELMNGGPPTIRSDLYALGVLLYQFLAGDFRKPLAAGWERNVADEELRSDVAATANDDPAQRLSSADELAKRLRSLDARRGAAVAERTREHEALRIRQKWARARARTPWLVGATVAMAASLAVSLWNYRQAMHAKDAASAQASIADAVIDFLDRDILAAASPFSVSGAGPARLSVRDAVDRAATKLDGRFPGQPAVEASIRAAIGQVYVEDGDYGAAEIQVRKAVQLSRAALGGADERVLRAEYGLAFALSVEQKFTEARALLDEANGELAHRQHVSPGTALRRDVINGNYFFALQDFHRAAPYFESALAQALRLDATDVGQIAIRQTSLAWCYVALGRFEAAWPLYAAALAAVRHAESNGGTLTGTVEERYGIGLFLAGRGADAKTMLTNAHRDLKAAIGDDGLTAEALTYLGWLELRDGRPTDAARTLREAYAQELASAGAEHRMSLRARACLGLAQIAAAEPLAGMLDLKAAVVTYERVLGTSAPEAQLFHFLLIEAQLAADQVPPDAQRQIRLLDSDLIAQAAPWENWAKRRAELQAGIARRAPAQGG